MAGILDTIADYAVPDVLVNAAKAVRDADWLGVEGAKRNKAYFKRKREADARRDKVNRSREGGLSVYRPATATNALYDLVGKGTTGLHRAFGASERDAAQAGHRLQDSVESAGSILGDTIGWGDPVELEKSATRIADGKSSYQDKVNIALMAAGPVGKAVGRGAKAVGRGIKAVAPETVGRVGSAVDKALDWALPTGPIAEHASFPHAGQEIFHPGGDVPDLRVARVPRPPTPAPAPPRALEGPPPTLAVEGPPEALALPYRPTQRPGTAEFKPKGGQWFPDKNLQHTLDPREEGWRVRDRGEHADPDRRYELASPRGLPARTFGSEEDAWDHADTLARNRTVNLSPEEAARTTAQDIGDGWETEEQYAALDPVRSWLQDAAAKYYKRDFGTANDPMFDLIRSGGHWEPGMTTDRWRDVIRDSLGEDDIGYLSVPKFGTPKGQIQYETPFAPQVLSELPGLAKAPVTDNIYSMTGAPPLGDAFYSELPKLFDPASDLPANLKIDPAKVDRINFPEAARRVGKAAEFRREQARQAGIASMEHPAVHPFKVYPDDPRGMQWVELKKPSLTDEQLSPETQGIIGMEDWNGFEPKEQALEKQRFREEREKLDEALKYEGEQQKICVGQDAHGYCNKVIKGQSNIFSLRDATGKPHVTVETTPGKSPWDLYGSEALDKDTPLAEAWDDYAYGTTNDPRPFVQHIREDKPHLYDPSMFDPMPPRIAQIKGYDNSRPSGDLAVQPFISDFVKSGKWGGVDDLGHTNLMEVPGEGLHGRWIDKGDFDTVVQHNDLDAQYRDRGFGDTQFPRNPVMMDPADWDQFKHHFEGYAKGGRVEAPIPSLRVRDPYEQGLAVADTLRTVLPPEREQAYQDWRVKLPKGLQYEGDYDLRGAYLANAKEAANGHMTDEFKLPNHRTFSTGSRYASAVNPAGRWVDNVFWADPANFRYQSGDEFADYINREEVPHGNFAVLPSDFDLRRR